MAGERWFQAALAAAGLLCAVSVAPGAVAASFSPSAPAVTAGGTFAIALDDIFSGSGANSGVGAIDLQVLFDPTLLSLNNVTDGTLLTGADWDPAIFNPGNGVISISEGINGDDLSGSGEVLLLTFGALGKDPTTTTSVSVQTSSSAVGVAGEYQLAQVSGRVSITAAAIPVPEPATFLLLMLPALALLGLKYRNG